MQAEAALEGDVGTRGQTVGVRSRESDLRAVVEEVPDTGNTELIAFCDKASRHC